MVLPPLAPGMKQHSDLTCFRIDPGQIRSFVEIAIDAREGEIVESIAAAVNFRDGVLDMKRRERRIILMQMTILASVLRTLANLSPNLCADHLRMGVGDLLRLSFKDRDELVRPHIASVLGALIVSEFTFR
jgi:hypothetical protein